MPSSPPKNPPHRGKRFSKPKVGQAFAEMYRRRKLRDHLDAAPQNPDEPQPSRSAEAVAQALAASRRRQGKADQARSRATAAKQARARLDQAQGKTQNPSPPPETPAPQPPNNTDPHPKGPHNGRIARTDATQNVRRLSGGAGAESGASSSGQPVAARRQTQDNSEASGHTGGPSAAAPAGEPRNTNKDFATTARRMTLANPLYRDPEIETALRESMGNFTKAAGLLAVAESMVTGRQCEPISREALAAYVSRVPYLCEVLDDIRERNLDMLEDTYWSLVRDKNAAAVFFGLKCHGKSRGWIESARGELDWRAGDFAKGDATKPAIDGEAQRVDIRQLPKHLQDNLGELLLAIEKME